MTRLRDRLDLPEPAKVERLKDVDLWLRLALVVAISGGVAQIFTKQAALVVIVIWLARELALGARALYSFGLITMLAAVLMYANGPAAGEWAGKLGLAVLVGGAVRSLGELGEAESRPSEPHGGSDSA